MVKLALAMLSGSTHVQRRREKTMIYDLRFPVEQMISRFTLVLSVGLVALGLFAGTRQANAAETIQVTKGQTVIIQSGAWYPAAFRFSDGRICVNDQDNTMPSAKWSSDGGKTWQAGPKVPGISCIELGGGEMLSIPVTATHRRKDGKYTVALRRSLDGWKTVTDEVGVVDVPQTTTTPSANDAGQTDKTGGFDMNHGILRLNDGRLMATMHGLYECDKTPAEGFPAEWKCRKLRVIVVFSSDKGHTWGDPVTVAAGSALPRACEGACEPTLTRAANGEIICALRSGGQVGHVAPCYVSRSADEGKTWSKPVAILDRGVWPHLLTMSNGIVVCTTGRPGDWLVFSADNGHTWQDALCFYDGGPYPACSSYNAAFEVAPNTILVISDRTKPGGKPDSHEIVGTFFTVAVRRTSP
jgi:hypothetical protein